MTRRLLRILSERFHLFLSKISISPFPRIRPSSTEECYKFVHDDTKLGRFFEEDAKLVLRKQELIEKRDRLSKANAAMANIQVGVIYFFVFAFAF